MSDSSPHRLLPDWIRDVSGRSLGHDAVAGLSVATMLVPQSMAYALLAGMPAVYGLYASLVPLLVYPLIGTSRHVAVGIMAIDSMIVAAGVSAVVSPGGPGGAPASDYISAVLLLGLMVGGIQILMGALRLGFVVNLLSRPVIAGFTAAAALTIGVGQFGSLTHIPVPGGADVFDIARAAFSGISQFHALSFLMSACGIILLVALQRWARAVPGPLVAVVLGGLAVWIFGLGAEGVSVVGTVEPGLPDVTNVGAWSFDMAARLFPTAVTLSLVQFMTVMSLGKMFATRHGYRIRPNRELIAVGAMNAAGAFFRSVPVSASFSRSAVNDRFGASTPLSNVFAAAFVGLTLLFLTPLLRFLPIPVLGAIILVAVFSLIDIRELRFLLRTKRIDGVIALGTFAATLVVGIHLGVLVGIGLSVIAIMYRISRPNIAVLGHLGGTRSFRDIGSFGASETIRDVLMLRIDASFSFANADHLRDTIVDESARRDVEAVVIDASGINDIDTTALTVIAELNDDLIRRGVSLHFGGVKEPVMVVLRESGVFEDIGGERFHLSPHRAVHAILEGWGRAEPYLDRVNRPEDFG
ncbi:MAG: sulfate permease [Rhodothermales bacterium]|nr:sulfate permease [Rhodothermales bacterium]